MGAGGRIPAAPPPLLVGRGNQGGEQSQDWCAFWGQLGSQGTLLTASKPDLGAPREQGSGQKDTWTLQGLGLGAPCPVPGQLTAPSSQEPQGSSRGPLPTCSSPSRAPGAPGPGGRTRGSEGLLRGSGPAGLARW